MIDHTGFSVTNFEASKLFYTRVLESQGHVPRHEIPDHAVGFGPAHCRALTDSQIAYGLCKI